MTKLQATGNADFGNFIRVADTYLFTTNGKTGVGTLTVTVAGLTAKARISTGTGMVARVEENEYKGKPVTVYTPGGIKIAELPPQSEVIVWDGLSRLRRMQASRVCREFTCSKPKAQMM